MFASTTGAIRGASSARAAIDTIEPLFEKRAVAPSKNRAPLPAPDSRASFPLGRRLLACVDGDAEGLTAAVARDRSAGARGRAVLVVVVANRLIECRVGAEDLGRRADRLHRTEGHGIAAARRGECRRRQARHLKRVSRVAGLIACEDVA